jgi:nucleotide-binding universal stress UspA family protein
MKSLLVPTDFSASSRNAIEYAALLAKKLDASLLLFHAYMIPTPVSEVSYAMVTVDEMQEANENNIKKEADYLQSTYGLEVDWLVRIGIASDEVKVLLQERPADLVVMGMKGAGGLDKIIGSTTTNVIRKVKTPVLIIPQDAKYGSPLTHITYASDLSALSSPAIFDPVLAIARGFQATIEVIHVNKTGEVVTPGQLAGRKSLENVLAGHHYEFADVRDDSVTHGINEYLKQHPCNLLVMTAHKHNFFERIFSRNHTTAMAYESHIPLLVLQDKE